MIDKYTSVSYEVKKHKNGGLIQITDLIKFLDDILDDDSSIIRKINDLFIYLKEGM